jgi:catechol 2,3-dioxygenase-like lactoylglutathione lyase family enzyme
VRLNHITLIVTDLERSKAFYRTLGLTQIVDAPPRYARFVFPSGDATLSVEVKGEPDAAQSATTEIFFECEAVDETVAALKTKGVHFDQDPADMFYFWREARLRDPDGHELRLYKDLGDYRLNPPWKLREAKAAL